MRPLHIICITPLYVNTYVCIYSCILYAGALISTTASLVALWVVTVTVFGVVTAVLSWQNFKLKQKGMAPAKPYR